MKEERRGEGEMGRRRDGERKMEKREAVVPLDKLV